MSSASKVGKGIEPQLSLQAIRKAALADVVRQAESKEGTGKMKGKVGIITGVGPLTGIGTATTRLMAREGAAHLYLLDFVEAQLQALATSLRTEFPAVKFTTVAADAASSSAISNLVDRALAEEGHLDFFFANAGISQLRPKGDVHSLEMLQRLTRTAVDIPEEEYTEIMRINALSVFLAIKYAAPALSKICPEKGKHTPGGSLVLTASRPMPYSASKAAVVSMAQTASYELAGRNIRVNAICPGLIQTDMTKGLFDLAEMGGKTNKMGSINPMMRQGLAHEVAQLATFLASDDASYVNGQAIACDGGLTSGVPYVPVRTAKL